MTPFASIQLAVTRKALAAWARDAIRGDGLEIDAASLAFCPREWINSTGYVDLELVRIFPLMLAL